MAPRPMSEKERALLKPRPSPCLLAVKQCCGAVRKVRGELSQVVVSCDLKLESYSLVEKALSSSGVWMSCHFSLLAQTLPKNCTLRLTPRVLSQSWPLESIWKREEGQPWTAIDFWGASE